MWDESEIVLAKCFQFDIDLESGVITAEFIYIAKQPLFNFIQKAFRNFSQSMEPGFPRHNFYMQIEKIYDDMDAFVLKQIQEKLPYGNKYYAHQVEGTRFAYFNRCTFLAFQMRLGKSIISASLSRLFNIKRTLIICPAVAKMGWFNDLTSQLWGFNPLYFTVLDAAKSRTFMGFQERFVICNYDSLDKFMPYLLKERFGHIIIDEIHRCKNRNSLRFSNVEKIVHHNENPKLTMLSGTAIPNRFNDLYSYFKLTGHHLGESYKKFTEDFTIKTNNRGGEKITGAKNIADLKLKMSNFMLVKEMSECFDMPEDVISRYTFQMDDYRAEYDKIIQEMTEAKELSRLNGHIHSLNLIITKAKIPGIILALEEIIAETGKVVVFGTYKEPLQMLQDYFKERCLKVVGGVSSFDRDRYKTQFHNDPTIEVFLANYEAGGEALDLSVSNDVFFINFPFTPRELNQAKFRCKHPEKRDQHLRIHFTFCEDSLDEYIYEDIILDKERDINALLHDGRDVIEREYITEKLIKKLLKKDDINFKVPRSKALGVVEEKEAEVDKSPKGLDDKVQQYHLMTHESGCSWIDNDEQMPKDMDMECDLLFSHHDVNEVIKCGRHHQQSRQLSFDENYTPNTYQSLTPFRQVLPEVIATEDYLPTPPDIF